MNEEEEKKEILRKYRSLLRALKPKLKPGSKEQVRVAFEMAAEAHKTTRRKSGEPYILHPVAVAMICVEEIGLGVRSTICALLHDTVEDTDITFDYLAAEGFDETILNPLELLTKQAGDDYELYVQRLAVNACSRAVKKADLFDNLDLTGLENPPKKRIMTIEKYGRALVFLSRFPQPRV